MKLSRHNTKRSGVVLITAALLILGCAPSRQESAVLRLGVIGPFSGPLVENVGSYIHQGAELAVAEAKARGGVDTGRHKVRIEVIFEDSRDRAESAVEAARKLVYQDKVTALIGPCLSRTALAVASFAEQNQIPMISPMSSHPELTVGKPYVFRTTIVDDLQVQALTRYLREDVGAETAGVLYDVASVYNRNIAELFRQTFATAGGEVVAFEPYTTGENDFRTPLLRIREADPEVLLLPNYVDDVPDQASQARELGIESILVGADSWDSRSYPLLDALQGSFFVTDWVPLEEPTAGSATNEFLAAYRAKFGRRPTVTAALAYDSIGLLTAAIEARGSLEPESIRQGLADLEGYPGITGTFSFRGGGDPTKNIAVLALNGGDVHLVKWMQP